MKLRFCQSFIDTWFRDRFQYKVTPHTLKSAPIWCKTKLPLITISSWNHGINPLAIWYLLYHITTIYSTTPPSQEWVAWWCHSPGYSMYSKFIIPTHPISKLPVVPWIPKGIAIHHPMAPKIECRSHTIRRLQTVWSTKTTCIHCTVYQQWCGRANIWRIPPACTSDILIDDAEQPNRSCGWWWLPMGRKVVAHCDLHIIELKSNFDTTQGWTYGDRINLPADNNVPGWSMSTQFEWVDAKRVVNRKRVIASTVEDIFGHFCTMCHRMTYFGLWWLVM